MKKGEYTSIIKHLREMEDEDEENALESYIDVLVKRLALYDKEEKPLEKFLEEILLEYSSEDRQGKMNKKGVKLMTVHTSKGLEFPYVFVVDISSDNFPNDKSLDLEEDRRLFYVALTRAKVELILS
ncbi:3'-5' exonuclease, partial [Microbacterium sp. BG28]|uniref:3'-5' exonuclease n=1 Tax=Microbacterium sp. BG28 TaxID=3097356 RepID=UPI002A5A1D86